MDFFEGNPSPSDLTEWAQAHHLTLESLLVYWRRYKKQKKGGLPVPKAEKPKPEKLPVTDEIKHKRELASLRARVSQLLREQKILLKQANLWEQLKALVVETTVALSPVEYPVADIGAKESSPETFCIQLTDWHYGEVVSLKETAGVNRYNRQIAVRRLEAYSEMIRDWVGNKLKGLNFHRAVVFVTGDMVSGLIHDELVRTNEVGIISQSVEAAHYLAQFLKEVATVFPEVHVVCTVGNHGRDKQKKEAKGQQQSFDRLVYLMVKEKLANQKNLTWDIPEAVYAVTEVEGHWICSQHGNHAVGASPLGIIGYSLIRMASKLLNIFMEQGKPISLTLVGHKHTEQLASWALRKKVLMGPALKGADEFSINDLGYADDAGQLCFGFHKKVGKTWSWVFNLQNVGERPLRYTLYQE